jgi:protein FRA10AC1
MRWRTKEEVLSGKGETICSNKICDKFSELRTYEVNFKYKEEEEVKSALVKVKCCEECSIKLNYKVSHNNYLFIE